MDEQYLKDLYNWIITKDKSFGTDYSPEQFVSDMGDSEYASEMYGWVSKNDPTFSQDYSLQDFLKDVGADKKKGGVLSNALSGITGFLEEGDKINQEAKKRSGSLTAKDAEKKLNPLQKERIKSITEFVEPPTDAEIFGSKKGIIKTTPEGEPIYTPPTVSRESTSIEKPIDIAAEKTKEQERIKAEEKRKIEQDYKNIRNWQSSNRLDEQESKKLLEDEQMRAKEAFERTSSDKDLMSGLGSITSDLIGQSEEKVVPLLNEKFSKYGFSFAQSSWADDEMVVTTEDGKNSITIDLNPSKSVDKQKEANKLKDFLSKFNIAPEKEKSFIDKEGEKFYAERGRDYYTEKRRWERYSELSEIVGFFEGYGGDKEELQKEHPELFFEGDARWDIKDKIKEYKKELETLTPLIKDNTFFNQKSNSIERTREDFDSYIAKEENKIAKKSADLNQEAKAEEDIIRLEARTKFNMDFEDLLYMKSDNPEYQKEIDGLIQRFITAQDARKQAFMNYEDAKLYYDEKINKEIEGDLTDDFQAVWNTVGDNFKEGMVNDQLLAIALPGMYIPYSGTTDIKEATEYIIKKRQQMSGTQSRVEVRLANAKTKEEYLDIMLDNPLESIAVASAGSIALMLPTAVKIIPAFILGGGVTGAVAGSPGGLAGMGTGFATGAKKGLEVGQAVNNFAVEYTAAVMESVKKRGYNAMDPESLQAALEDPRTWKDAEAQATARGIPIAIADYLSSNLVGRVFKPASKIASIPTRTALGIAERAVVDPLMESGGELFAQASEIVTGTGRTELDWKEIAAEGRGAMGSKVPNLAIKMYSDIKNNRNIDLARNLTTIHNVGIETASDTRISNWANNMQKLGKIDADVNQRIQENVGLKRDAREVLNIGQTNKKTEGPVVGRVMELLSAKKELSATKNRQEVYSEKIKEINNELATISQTKELLPTEKRVSLDGIIEAKRSDVSEYMINGRTYNKEGFINKINTMSPNRLGKASIGVKGDPETSNIIKEKYNAIQKQTTGKVSLQPEAGVGEAMVEGESQPGLEVTTEKIVLSPEENKRKENLTAALTQPENKEGTIVIDDTPMNRDEAQAELDNLIKKETAPVKTEEKISILETPDNTAKALTELSTEEKTNVTFTNQEGKNVPVNGNEKVLSDLYHEAIKIDEDQRTDAQQSAIDTVELSLMEKVKAERDAKQIEQIASRAKAKTEATKNAGISITNKASVDTVKTNVSNQLKTATTEQQKTRVKEKVKIIEKAQKAINTLKSILPNFDIVIHDNEGSYNARMEEVNGDKSSGGSFSYQKNADGTYSGKIDINLEKANLRTVAHEVAHAIMLKAFGDNPALFKNFRDRISKVLTESSNEALMKFANQYEGDVTYEEYLVELTAALENEDGNIAPTILMKIASIINSVVSKISNGAIKPFEDIKKTKDLIEFFNSISNSIREGDDVTSAIEKLNNQQAYSEGVAIEVSDPKEFTATPISKSRIADYKDTNKIEILNTAKIPTKTLTEKVREYEGRVIIITSDATGYGIDSEGNPILGGPGFANNKKNVDDGIGFASLNIGTVKSTYTMAEKSYGKSKTLVLIMVQPPHTTINNSYGSNYIIRGLMEIGKKNKDELAKAIDSIKGFVSKSKSVQKEFKNESKKAEGEAKTRSTQDALFKVLDKIKDAKNKEELVNEYLNVTTFNIRKAIGLGILSPNKNTKTNKSTTYSKVAFNNIGYTIYDFLKEYGDQTILNDNMILKNKGGYVVAGFELDVLDTDKRDALISETQSKGIVHPLFNAKLPGKNHFVLDGLYSVNDNFAQYAKADKEIDYSKISKEEINKLVRENLKEDKFYTIASREKPLSERTYTDLKAEGKGLLKFKILGESKLKDKKPDVATKVSKGEGFSPVKGAAKKMAETKFKPITKSQKVKQDAEVLNNLVINKIIGGKKSKFINKDGSLNIEETLKSLSDKFSIPFEIINDPDQNYSGKFEDGRVYINSAYVTAETPWHEFAHPFIEEVKEYNPKLYSSLVNEIKTSTYGKQVLAEVKELYSELNEEGQIEEAIVETIAMIVTGKVSKTELKENKAFFQKVLDFVQSIKDALAKMLGVYSVNIADLNNNFTLKYIAEIMQYGGRINLKEYSPIINKNKSKEVRYYTNGKRLFGEQKSIADEFSNLVDYIKKTNNGRLSQIESFLKLKYLLKKDLSFLPKEIIEKYEKIIDDVLVIYPNKKKERTKENLKADNIFYKSKLDEIILLYPKLQIEKKSKDLPSIQFKNQWTVKDFKSAYHNIGAYMNNAGISSVNDAIDNFINLLSIGSKIELAAYSSESALQTIGGVIRLKFKQETPVIRSYLADVQSSLIDNNGKLERITEKGNLQLRTDIDEEIKTSMFSSYDELFINATENNVESINILENISTEELNKLKELSELTGANIVQDGNVLYKPSKTKEYKPFTVKYSKFSKNNYSDIIKEARANGIGEDGIRLYFRNIGLSEVEIDTLLETEKGAAKKVEVSERTLPGFDRMMEQVQNIIDKSKERRATKQKTFENVMNYLEGSKAYQNATDVQREQMVRDIRKMFGKREKTAPSVGKIFGDVKNVNKITLTEKQLIDKQIKDLNRGAKDAKSAWLNASAIVAKAVKELVLSGKITTTQATNVISRFAKVNMFDDSSIERFVDYMSKVFEDANYLEKISNAKKLLPTAKNNVRTKIGISEVLTPLLSKLFNLNPSIIPDSVFESYLEVVDMMGKRQAVLTLKEVNDLTDQVNEILDTVQDELSTLDELIDIFNNYEGKITDEKGNIDFSKTLAAMVSDENKPITFEDAELLKKYKSKVIPRLQKPKMSAEQKAEEKNALIKSIREFDVKEDNLPTREERDLARSLIQLLRTKGLDGLTNSELTNLLKVLDNINNGFISHYALLMREKLNAVNNAVVLNETIKRASSLPITKLIAKIKSLFPLQPSTQKIMVRETPKYFIDQVFGFFKDKPIFKTVFQAVAQGYSRYKTDANIVQEKLDKAFNKVTKSHWNNPRKVKMSTFKMMTYALQMEYESNIDSQNFYTASEYINATIKNGLREDSNMSEYDVNLLKNILKVYGKVTGKDENGKDIIEIDTNKLYDSFNPAEKSAIKTIQEVNSSLKDKALFTSAVIRGDKVKVYDNYIHHSVLPSAKSNNVMATMSSAQAQNNLMNPSTRAKSLMERTKGVKPLNFDIFSVTQKSANQILLDFHLTEPVRTARKTLKLTDENKNDTLKETRVFEAIDDAFETALRNVLMNSYNDNSFANSVVNFLTRQAYRTILASASRWASELGSNLLFVMTTDPRSYILGATKYKKVVMSENAIKILQNTGSTQSERLYSDSLLSGRMIDNSSMGQAVGLDGSPTKNAIANAIQTIHNNTTKKYGNFVAATSDTMISTPDKMMMRPFWFGVFANNFKKITGQEVDFNKIAENDEAYMNQFKDAIDFSTSNADQMSVFSGTTTNPFMTRQKGTRTPGMNPLVQFYNTFNSFMNNFIVYEYITARTGIYAAMGAGTISRGQGARLLAATILRTTSYTLLSKMLAETLLTTILGPNEIEEEEDEKTVFQQIGQATAGSMTSLMLGRDFGNMSRSLINYGVERVNENYLEFLREGEYDYYKDAITYSAIPPEKAKPDPLDLIVNVAGPLQPTLKLFRRGYINLRSPESETESVNTGRELERYYKLPIELLGNVGVIPLYKDVQKVVNEQVKRKVAEAKFYEERRGK